MKEIGLDRSFGGRDRPRRPIKSSYQTQGQREQVVQLMLEGQSAAAVARAVGCDYRSVQRWWTQWLEDERDHPLEDRVGGRGRPRETTTEEDARIVAYAEQHIFCTAGEIRAALELRHGWAQRLAGGVGTRALPPCQKAARCEQFQGVRERWTSPLRVRLPESPRKTPAWLMEE